jgi:hypothetical protein
MKEEKRGVEEEKSGLIKKTVKGVKDFSDDISWKGVFAVAAAVIIYFGVPKVGSVIDRLDPKAGEFDSKYKKVLMKYADRDKNGIVDSLEYFSFHSNLFNQRNVDSFTKGAKLSYNDDTNWPKYLTGQRVSLDSLNSWLGDYLK